MAATTAAVPEAPRSMGAFARVIGALFSPRATFQDIARKPSWLLPLLILIILSMGITTIFSHRVGWRAFMEKQNLQSRSTQQRMQGMTPEQREHMVEMQVKIAPIAGYIGAIVGFPVISLVIAAIFTGIFNATSSASLDFKTSFGVVTHSYMPFAIPSILGILVLYLKPPDTVDLQNLVASNVGALLSKSAPMWQQSTGTSLDIFTFWVLGLMAFGYSVVRPKKLKIGTSLAWVVGVWVVYVLIKAGLLAIIG